MQAALHLITQNAAVSSCFAKVFTLCANLTAEENRYKGIRAAYGPNAMFEGLFRSIWGAYGYMFLMEADTSPIKPLWLDRLLWESVLAPGPFWVKGSACHGCVPDEPFGRTFGDRHINGNALYNLHDTAFRDFILHENPGPGSYDIKMMYFVMRRPAAEQRQWLTKFIYSNVIWNQGNLPYIPSSLPDDTVLVHGLYPVDMAHQSLM